MRKVVKLDHETHQFSGEKYKNNWNRPPFECILSALFDFLTSRSRGYIIWRTHIHTPKLQTKSIGGWLRLLEMMGMANMYTPEN